MAARTWRRVSAPVSSIGRRHRGSLTGRFELVLQSAGHSARLHQGRPGERLNYPVSFARKMVLQVAVQDIGQLTDI
jgi:hypothetical protein